VTSREPAVEELLRRAAGQWHESGDLSHLKEHPIDLSDTSENWFANRLLRREGFSHPLIERGKDIDERLSQVDQIEAALTTVSGGPSRRSPEALTGRRVRLPDELRQILDQLSVDIFAYNTLVPTAMQKPVIDVEGRVARAERLVGERRE
jgi:hypothetical protein